MTSINRRIDLCSVLGAILMAAAMTGCTPKEPKPGEPTTGQSTAVSDHASSTAWTESKDFTREATCCEDKPAGPASRFGPMPLMNHIA